MTLQLSRSVILKPSQYMRPGWSLHGCPTNEHPICREGLWYTAAQSAKEQYATSRIVILSKGIHTAITRGIRPGSTRKLVQHALLLGSICAETYQPQTIYIDLP